MFWSSWSLLAELKNAILILTQLCWRKSFSTEVNRNENIEIMVDNKSRTIKWEIGYKRAIL
jgi:hypothetical protein